MKRVWKQCLALMGASVLFLSYQNCGKSVNYTNGENVFDGSSTDPWAQMGEFAKTTQSVAMRVSSGFRACYGECPQEPDLKLNFAAKTFSFTFGYMVATGLGGPGGGMPETKYCAMSGSMTSDDELTIKQAMDTMMMRLEPRSNCYIENGQEVCPQIADAASMDHEYVGPNQSTKIYNPGWDTNMNGSYMFYQRVPWNWYCGVKKFLEDKSNSQCPREMIGQRLRDVFTIESSFQGTCE